MMQRKVKIGIGIIIAICVLGLVGCMISGCWKSKTQDAPNPAAKMVGISMHFMRDDYANALVEELSFRLDEVGYEYIITDAGGDPIKQTADIEGLISSGVDAIVVCPMGEDAIKNSLREAEAKDIPVVTITKIPDINAISTISGGDYQNGLGAGQAMKEALGGRGKVLLTDFPYDVYRLKERLRGFMDGISGSDIEVMDFVLRTGTNEETMEAIKQVISENPDLKGIFTSFSNQTIGCGAALKALDRRDIVITGIDADEEVLDLINEGWIRSVAAQFPTEHGRLAADAISKYFNHEVLEKTYKVPFMMVDQANADAMRKSLWGK